MRNEIKFNKKIKGWRFLIMLSYYCETFRSKDIAMLILKDSYLQQKLIKFILKYYVWNLLKNLLDIFYYFFHLNQDFMAKNHGGKVASRTELSERAICTYRNVKLYNPSFLLL